MLKVSIGNDSFSGHLCCIKRTVIHHVEHSVKINNICNKIIAYSQQIKTCNLGMRNKYSCQRRVCYLASLFDFQNAIPRGFYSVLWR